MDMGPFVLRELFLSKYVLSEQEEMFKTKQTEYFPSLSI